MFRDYIRFATDEYTSAAITARTLSPLCRWHSCGGRCCYKSYTTYGPSTFQQTALYAQASVTTSPETRNQNAQCKGALGVSGPEEIGERGSHVPSHLTCTLNLHCSLAYSQSCRTDCPILHACSSTIQTKSTSTSQVGAWTIQGW